MRQIGNPTSSTAALDYDSTMIGALQLSSKKWVYAVQLPGVRKHTRHVLEASGAALTALIERLKARSEAAGRPIGRVILTHGAGRDGFWIARFLERRGIEIYVMQSSSLPVDRRARRAKTDVIDVEMLLCTLMAWLWGEPRVCSMVPIPSDADEEARRAPREREDLIGARRSILNKIDGILATLGEASLRLQRAWPAGEAGGGIVGYRGLRRDRRAQLADLHQPDGEPIPPMARARIERLLDRLELVLGQIKAVEETRDAVVTKPAANDESERMIRDLAGVRGVGVESATLLVREAFARTFRNRRALGAYAGLTGTPFSSGTMEREQGIGKDGNRRLRALVVELAWFWLRFQPDSALAKWFRERVGQARGRVSKIMIVAEAAQTSHCVMAFRQGRRHSGGSDDESITPTFIAASLPVRDRRSPSIAKDPQGRRFSEWLRRTELLLPNAGIVVWDCKPYATLPARLAPPTGYEVGREPPVSNRSSPATGNGDCY